MHARPLLLVAAALVVAGCATKPPPASAGSSASPAAGSASAAASARAATGTAGEPCGALECRSFTTAREAFEVVLAARPLALGIGESHAQRGSEGVASATRRFTDELLPALAGKASFLLVELMMPNDKCKKETKQVARQQAPATQPQAATNQSEYVALGTRARALGIVPDLLRPSCDDLTRITQAGADDIDLMLRMTATLTTGVVSDQLDRDATAGKGLMVVSYGGALHNDVSPKAGHEAWSYGPALAHKTGGRYVELDLVVPEYIRDSEAWTSLPWYPHYDRARLGKRAVLLRVAPSSYALVLPESAPAPE